MTEEGPLTTAAHLLTGVKTDAAKNPGERNPLSNYGRRLAKSPLSDKMDVAGDIDSRRTCMSTWHKRRLPIGEGGPSFTLIHEGSDGANLNAGTAELAARVFVGFAGGQTNNDSSVVKEKAKSPHAHHIAADADAPPAEDTEVIVSVEKGLPLDFREAFMAIGKGDSPSPI